MRSPDGLGSRAFTLLLLAACGRAVAAPSETTGPSPRSTASSPTASAMTLGPPSSSQGPPQRGDRCAPFVADEAEDYTWRISEFAVLEWIDVDAVVKVLTRECATWTDQEFRCVTDRSPGAQDKRTCLSSEPLGRLRASLQPILDTPTPADVRGESKGRVRCEYPALVKRELQSCSNVPMKMRQKVLKQWYRASTVATPHQVCLDAETVLRRRLAQAGCPVESARK